MEQAAVILKKGEGRTLKAGGAWIFDNEIDKVEGTPEDGSLVEVRDFDGYGMGTGFYNSRSKIRVRMMSRKPGITAKRQWIPPAAGSSSARRTSCPVWWWISFRMCWWCSRWLWALTA